jgi:hypothetical protein
MVRIASLKTQSSCFIQTRFIVSQPRRKCNRKHSRGSAIAPVAPVAPVAPDRKESLFLVKN